MNNVERALKKELELTKIQSSKGLTDALTSLLSSAGETGLLSVRMDIDEAIIIWKLVEIAKGYRTKLPDSLRM